MLVKAKKNLKILIKKLINKIIFLIYKKIKTFKIKHICMYAKTNVNKNN